MEMSLSTGCQHQSPVIISKLLRAERSSNQVGTSNRQFEVPMCTLKFPFEDFNFNFYELSYLISSSYMGWWRLDMKVILRIGKFNVSPDHTWQFSN